jgi:hypothetical protein
VLLHLPTQFSSPAQQQPSRKPQLFVFGQMWTSYVADFPNHFRVSEYVVKRNAPVSDITVLTPSEFCNGS